MPRKVITVQNTVHTLTDADGNALCHGLAANKSSQDNTREQVAVQFVLEIARRLNLTTGNGRVVTASGVARPRMAGQASRVEGAWDMGHVMADEVGGPYCLCNIVPQDGLDNLTEVTPTMRDGYEAAWFAMAREVMQDADPFAHASQGTRDKLARIRREQVRRQTGKSITLAEAASFTFKWMPASKRARIAA